MRSDSEEPTKARVGTTEHLGTCAPTPEPRLALSVGATINGRYTIEAVLGHGGMGIVYAVNDPVVSQTLALKTIRGDTVTVAEVDRFKTEFATMAQLEHPNVARAFDFARFDGADDYFFTMELIEGHNPEPRSTKWRATVDLVVQLCRGLSYMHSRKITHFDLKPANVLVDRAGCAKILDFGVAELGRTPDREDLRGTPRYMAPELTLDPDNADHRADLYSLGIMTFELLFGHFPYEVRDERMFTLIQAHQRSSLSFPPADEERVPEWIRALVVRLCAKNPADRFLSGNEVINFINEQGSESFPTETEETRESYVVASRFVGRENEFDVAKEFVAGRLASSGGPVVLCVKGGSGMGKSRLMRQLRIECQLTDVVFVESDCYEGGVAELGPWRDVLAALLPVAESLEANDLVEAVKPELARLSPSFARDASSTSASLEQEQVRFVERLTDFLVGLAGLRPFVLFINDVHWARASTVVLLRHLLLRLVEARNVGETVPLPVIVTMRPQGELSEQLTGLLNGIENPSIGRILQLEPLELAAVRELIASILGTDDVPGSFAERISAETKGSPFFVEEVMRALIEAGTVSLGTDRRPKVPAALDLPASIAATLSRRIETLPVDSERLMRFLAVAGRPTPLEVVANAMGITLHEAHLAARPVLNRRMARGGGRLGMYRVAHDRMREALVEALSEDTRASMHAAVARGIESTSGDEWSSVDALAYHYWEAKELEAALRYAKLAAKRARRELANGRAKLLQQRVLELSDPADRSSRLVALEGLGAACRGLGETDEAIEALDRARELAVGTDQARLSEARAAILLDRGDLFAATTACEEALAALGEPQRGPWLQLARIFAGGVRLATTKLLGSLRAPRPDAARLMGLKAHAYYRLTMAYAYGRPERVLVVAVRGFLLALAAPDPVAIAKFQQGIALDWTGRGRFDQAMRYVRKALVTTESIEDDLVSSEALASAAMVYFSAGEWDQAIRAAKSAAERLRLLGDLHSYSMAMAVLIQIAVRRGDTSTARAHVRRVRAFMLHAQSTFANYRAPEIWVDAMLGEGTPDLDAFDREARASLERGNLMRAVHDLIMAGQSYLALGRYPEAIDALRSAKRIREERGVRFDLAACVDSVWAIAELAQLFSERDPKRRKARLAPIERLVRDGLRWGRKRPCHVSYAELAHALYALAIGERTQAERAMRRAAVRAEELDARGLLAWLHEIFAEGLCVAGDPAEAEVHRAAARSARQRDPPVSSTSTVF